MNGDDERRDPESWFADSSLPVASHIEELVTELPSERPTTLPTEVSELPQPAAGHF